MARTITRHTSVEDFLTDAGAWLTAREAEHNLILGICSTLRDAPAIYPHPPYLGVVRTDGEIVAAAVQTPPWPLVLSEIDDLDVLDVIVADVTDPATGEPLLGVVGPPPLASAFADRWVAARGGAWTVGLNERIYQLEHVIPPRPTHGAMRHGAEADRELINRWVIEFAREALPVEEQKRVEETAASWNEMTGRTMFLWEVSDEAGPTHPVSLTGVSGATPHGIRIGPVYTPPEFRGRGYASALVAQVSRAQLDAGLRFCFLYTDLANPTSNRIYQAIGYEPVTDALRIDFHAVDPNR